MQQVVTCPGCGAQSVGDQFCTVCGTRLPIAAKQEVLEPEPAPAAAAPTAREAVPARKYGALRAVATVYRIIGWVVMVGGTLFSIALAVIAVQGAGEFSKFIPWGVGMGTAGIAAAGVVVSILFGLFLVAFADLCYVLIAIESNTRSKE
ncbi:MAG: hypothetical protein WCA51_08505 [Dehalococcoidia bacterium]